jgi:hypothetical protein
MHGLCNTTLFNHPNKNRKRRCDSVGIAPATGWTIGILGFDSRRGLGIFFFTTTSRTALGPTKPPIQWVTGALSLGVKWLGREADHSFPSSAEVDNAWSYTSTPQYVFMAWCLVKHRDNFTLTISGEVYKLWSFSLSDIFYFVLSLRSIHFPQHVVLRESVTKLFHWVTDLYEKYLMKLIKSSRKKMGGARSTYGRNEKCIQYFGWKTWKEEATWKP